MISIENNNDERDISWLERYSKYSKLVRVLGWVQRFLFNCKNKKVARKDNYLTSREFSNAEIFLLKLVQEQHFKELDDKRIEFCLPFRDEQGLIRRVNYTEKIF